VVRRNAIPAPTSVIPTATAPTTFRPVRGNVAVCGCAVVAELPLEELPVLVDDPWVELEVELADVAE
jgi:hypothetical protein